MQTPQRQVFESDLSSDTHWILAEHRIKGGEPLVPGTAYLELARAALAETTSPHRVIEVRDLQFATPFVVARDERKTMRIELERRPDGWSVQMTAAGATHVTGTVAAVERDELPHLDLRQIEARCDRVETSIDPSDVHLDFGPRWDNRQSIAFGDCEALLYLALPDAFASDLPGYTLHPALMDFAMVGAQSLIPGFSLDTHFYVPFSYGRLAVYAALTAELRSHVRLKESSDELAVYDVTICDPEGRRLVEIEDFVMRRVEDRAVMNAAAGASAATSIEARPDVGPVRPTPAASGTANPILELGLADGIAPAEGMEALERVLAAPMTSQIIVSSQDLDALIESTRPEEPWEAASSDETGAPKVVRPPLTNAFVAPETSLEKQVAAVWEELLGIDGVGLHDDFFDLGGHSLLLTQLVSRVRKQVKVELALRRLFDKRTVAGIAEEIERAQATESPRVGPDLRPMERAPGAEMQRFPASFAQRRLWYLDRVESGTAVYNIPQAFRLRGTLDVEALEVSVGRVVERHEALRTHFTSDEDGVPLQVVRGEGPFRLSCSDLSARPDAEQAVRAAIDEEAARGFALDRSPLFAAKLYRMAVDDHVLLFNVHHIVCDGWSLTLLFEELSALYREMTGGSRAALSPRRIQYADYANWQQAAFARGESLEQELAFWREELRGELRPLPLPFDRARPQTPSLRGEQIFFRLPDEEALALRAFARREKASLFMAAMAAFSAFLARITSEYDIRLGAPIANRDREEIRAGIGFYTNTLIFRHEVDPTQSFRQFVATVRERSLAALAHQEIPLELVIEAVNPDRSQGDNPVFQVMFALQRAPESALALVGLEAEPVLVHSRTSKFDLLLELQEVGETALQGLFEYATDLFDGATAQRMVDHFVVFLEGLLADPDVALHAIFGLGLKSCGTNNSRVAGLLRQLAEHSRDAN
ncbi:MAG: condensation domain-containing protein, partial [Myxococcota bacterium]